MRAITFQGIESLAFEVVGDPQIVDDGDLLVEVTAAGICGSDLHPYFGKETGLDRGTVMGHEFVGRVSEVGRSVRNFSPGDRVVAPFTTNCGVCFYCGIGLTARCDRSQLFGWVEDGVGLHGGQAEQVRVPNADATLVQLPDQLEDEALALLAGDILSTARFGAELSGLSEGDLVAVVGCGPVGILAIYASLDLGAREVVAIDRVPSRLELAARFGATTVNFEEEDAVSVCRARSDGRGADCAIEAVGTPGATRAAADLLRPGGCLAALGVHTEPSLAIPPGEIYDRNLRYAGGRCPARRFMPSSLEMAARDADLLGPLISHRLPLSEGVEGYRMFAAREPGCTKVVLTP